MLPNNHPNLEKRLEQLYRAIKLVYSSIFHRDAKSYIESTTAKTEEEKMAVIVQELVGTDHNGKFYPTFSGVAPRTSAAASASPASRRPSTTSWPSFAAAVSRSRYRTRIRAAPKP